MQNPTEALEKLDIIDIEITNMLDGDDKILLWATVSVAIAGAIGSAAKYGIIGAVSESSINLVAQYLYPW